MRYILIFILTLGFANAYSQAYEPESIAMEDSLILREFYYRRKFQIRLSHERTLLTSGVNIKLNNLIFGFQIKKNYKFGGILFISKSYRTNKDWLPSGAYYKSSILGYGAYFEYVIIDDYRYYVGFPLNITKAWGSSIAYNANNKRIREYDTTSKGFGMIALGVSGGLNLNYWLTLSVGLGYRVSYSGSKEENDLLTTPYYSLGVKLRFGNLMTSMFDHKEVQRMKQAYFRNKTSWRANVFRKRHRELYE